MKRKFLLKCLLLISLTAQLASACNQGQYDSGGICYKCLDNCRSCSMANNCFACKSGHFWDIGKQQCGRAGGLGTVAIVFLSVIGASVLLSSIIFICVYQSVRRHPHLIRMQIYQAQQPQQVPPQQMLKFSQQVVAFSSVKDQCSICLEQQTNIITPCNHYFHFNCLKQWSKQKAFCPNCKGYFSDLKSRCPKCKDFTRTFIMCRRDCKAQDHFKCVEGSLLVQCERCHELDNVRTEMRRTGSEVRLVDCQGRVAERPVLPEAGAQ